MNTVIRQVRRELLAWADNRPEPIRSRANIIARNLELLAHDPDNGLLRERTMRNVADLERERQRP